MMMRMEEGVNALLGDEQPPQPVVDLSQVDWKRVGRNDPCPCGSGKKFKACHYPMLRAEGII
jgi:preprotein translocase subunit SecA